MFDIVLTSAERALLEALSALGVRYLIVGMGAALIEGAPGTTQDIDLWFEHLDATELREAARRAGGFYTSGLGLQPPAVGGEGLDRVDWCSPRRDSSPSSRNSHARASTTLTACVSESCRSSASSSTSAPQNARKIRL